MTRVTGALVTGVQSAFAANWVYCCGEVIAGPRFYPIGKDGGPACGLSVVSSPSDAQQPIRLLLWLSFINARRRLWVASSYFIPDQHLRKAVQARARAGVDVRILVPGNHTDAIPVQYAGRGFYEELLQAGVRIFEYQPSMMHAKTVVVDDGWTLVGSANMDERSMEINEENLLGVAESSFARSVAEGFERDLSPREGNPPRAVAPAPAPPAILREGRQDPDRAVLARLQPPAIAATTVISSPSVTGVANPLRNRTSSSFR